jgi:hypothetical protein
MDPFAPITPEQERAIRLHLAGLGRLSREQLLKDCPELRQPHTLDAGRAATILSRLRGEPTAPITPEQPTDQRATNALLREKLDAGYAGRAMVETGLVKRSHFAGMNGNPHGLNC